MRTLWQDLRYGARMLWQSPGFAAVAVLSLALGIGANTSVFSFVNAVLLKPLPVADPARLIYVFSGSRTSPYRVASYPDYVDLRDKSKSFVGLAAYSSISVSFTEGEQAETLNGSIVSGNYFAVLGVRPALGRGFLPEEDKTPGAAPVAVISHDLWQSRFAGDASIVGRKIVLNGQPFTVVGVAPAGFYGAVAGRTNDLYVPLAMQALVRPPRAGYSGEMNPDLLSKRGPRWVEMVGRLKPGVSAEQARADVSTLAAQLAQAYPDTNKDVTATAIPVSKGDPQERGTLVNVASLLLAVVGLVLLIACANVANLLLARATARRREISIRLALGASRGRLIRQLLTESVFLSVVGGAIGLLLSVWLVAAMRGFRPPANLFNVAYDFSIDHRVLFFTTLLSILTGLAFGIAPAVQASNPDLVSALKDETPLMSNRPGWVVRKLPLRSALIVAQVALSLVLLVGAGLFLRNLWRAQRIDLGFGPERVFTMPLNINLLHYTKAQGQEFYRQVIERVETLPGVESVTLSRTPPLSGASRTANVTVEGASTDRASQSENSGAADLASDTTLASSVGLRYFETLRIPLLRGRDFNEQDREGAPGVAVVNQTFAAKFLNGSDPIGRRISLSGDKGPWLEIVGLARDSKYITVGERPQPFVYQPVAQRHENDMVLVVRARGDVGAAIAAVRSEVQKIDHNVPVNVARPMTELLSMSLFGARAGAILLGCFGALALLLATVGLYGVMSYSVSRRTREIGIRMALGAEAASVRRLVLREGMTLVALGVALGLVGALFVTRLLAGFLYGVSTSDPVSFVAIAALLSAVALVACLAPARRATKVDPMIALRYE